MILAISSLTTLLVILNLHKSQVNPIDYEDIWKKKFGINNETEIFDGNINFIRFIKYGLHDVQYIASDIYKTHYMTVKVTVYDGMNSIKKFKIAKLAGKYNVGPRVYYYRVSGPWMYTVIEYINPDNYYIDPQCRDICNILRRKIDLMHFLQIHHGNIIEDNLIIRNDDIFITNYDSSAWMTEYPNIKMYLMHLDKENIQSICPYDHGYQCSY